jgi:hypothetical protein
MFRNSLAYPILQTSSIFRLVLLLFVLSALWEKSQAVTPDQKDQLVQFTASGHMLGFQSHGFYVANGDHMLHVDFVRSTGAAPKIASAIKKNNRTQPLNRVTYTNLWPGIHLRYETDDKGILESTWEITPGASPEQIHLHYNAPVIIENNGSLKVDYETGWMSESAPIAWQEIDGNRQQVDVAFKVIDVSNVGFKIGSYDKAYPLMIDPVITWNTQMGSATTDEGRAIAVDDAGNVYVAGTSDSNWGSPITSHAGGEDAFVAKLNSKGVLQWNTFIGAASTDNGNALALDHSGNIYVAGITNIILAFAAKLDNNGTLLWKTPLGSRANFDYAQAIAVADSGNVYVAGTSRADWGLPVDSYKGGSEAFAAKLNNDGAIQWNTFMGSPNTDAGNAIALDNSENAYVTGASIQSWGEPVNPFGDGFDAFVVKLNASGVRQWNTFTGGGGTSGIGIAVDSRSGNIYIGGASSSSWGTPIAPHAGRNDAFVAKFIGTGELIWNTFMGSPDPENASAIVVDSKENIYVTGTCYSYYSWGSPINTPSGEAEAFAAKLDRDGVLQWNAFIGSPRSDYGESITSDNSGQLYVSGIWDSENDIVGGGDAFAAKLNTSRCKYYLLPLEDGTVFPACL